MDEKLQTDYCLLGVRINPAIVYKSCFAASATLVAPPLLSLSFYTEFENTKAFTCLADATLGNQNNLQGLPIEQQLEGFFIFF